MSSSDDFERVDGLRHRGLGFGAVGDFFGVGKPGVLAAVGFGVDSFVAEEIDEVYATAPRIPGLSRILCQG
jgi:hypothetical protein